MFQIGLIFFPDMSRMCARCAQDILRISPIYKSRYAIHIISQIFIILGDIEEFPIRFDNIVYQYYDKTRDARSSELSRVKPEGTPKGEGLYLTLNSERGCANQNSMSPKLHYFANLDLYALSVKKVALKKSENILPKVIHEDISQKINTFKFTEPKKNLALPTKMVEVITCLKCYEKYVSLIQHYSVSLKLTFFLSYYGNIREL